MTTLASVFAALKPVLAEYANRLAVQTDTSVEYALVTKSASLFPQHKGQPLYFGSVRLGKACETPSTFRSQPMSSAMK
jgi:hypothetical protein